MADDEAAAHKAAHPNYTYQPRKPGEKKRRLTKRRREQIAAAQQEPLSRTDRCVKYVQYVPPEEEPKNGSQGDDYDALFEIQGTDPWSFEPTAQHGILRYGINAEFSESAMAHAIARHNVRAARVPRQSPQLTTRRGNTPPTCFDIERSWRADDDARRNALIMEHGVFRNAIDDITFGRVLEPDILPGNQRANEHAEALATAQSLFDTYVLPHAGGGDDDSNSEDGPFSADDVVGDFLSL